MSVAITYHGDDDNVLAQVCTDAAIANTYTGSTHTAIEKAAVAGGVDLEYQGSDLNMIERFAAAISVGDVYGLNADITGFGTPFTTHDTAWLAFTQTLGSDGVSHAAIAVRPTYSTVPDFTVGPSASGIIGMAMTADLLFDSTAYDGSYNGYQISFSLGGLGSGAAANLVLKLGHAGDFVMRVAASANGSGASLDVETDTLTADEAIIVGMYVDKSNGHVGVVMKRAGVAAVDLGFLTVDESGNWVPDGSGAFPLLMTNGDKWPLLGLTDNTQASQDIAGAVVHMQVHADAAEIDALGLPWPVGTKDVFGVVI